MSARLLVSALGLAPLLAACSAAPSPETVARNAIAGEFNALARVYGGDMPQVQEAQMPASGGARYDGAMTLVVAPAGPAPGAEILGRARVDVDFAAATVTGDFRDFVGRVGQGRVVAWSARAPVTLSGSYGPMAPPYEPAELISAVMTGTLANARGDVVEIRDLTLGGTFRDPAPSATRAPAGVVLQSTGGSILVNEIVHPVAGGVACTTCLNVAGAVAPG